MSDLFGNTAPAPRRAIGGHQSSRAGTHTWLTPLPLIRSLGRFGVDPCAVPGHPTADRLISLPEDGLSADWGDERAWVNPPYGHYAAAFLRKLARHGFGTALIFARTETEAFFAHVWGSATALLFLEGRVNFHWAFEGGVTGDPTGCDHGWAKMDPSNPKSGLACVRCGMSQANSGAPSVLVAYGHHDAEVLGDRPLPGAFVPLQLPRFFVIAAVTPTWREAVVDYVRARRGPVRVDDLYRAFAKHPKTRDNRHWKAKLRQVMQRGPFERIGRGEWRMAV